MHVHWHRRDLRLRDNRGLARAAADGPVVPVFVLDPAILEYASSVRVACLLDGLAALRARYRERESDLLVVRGDPREELPRLAAAHDADLVTWNDDYSGVARERDRAVAEALADRGVETATKHDALHHEPGSISPNRGDHYAVFSYFWRKWRERSKRAPVEAPGPAALEDLDGESLPTLEALGFDHPEATVPEVDPVAARDRLSAFCASGIYHYATDREYPAREGTSRLSVDLRWGTIGVRETYAAVERAANRAASEDERRSVEAFRRQLAWREFYAHVLAYNPSLTERNYVEFEREVEWRNDPNELAAWKAGETGYPIVDAGMRQLRAEAWMHNRVRMLVASFLTKDLRIDWRKGYDWFRRTLADHDTANDVGGWQWAASTGTDAQPYFRVFNPTKQGREYDPDGEYVRTYVPELADATTEAIHGWTELDPEERTAVAPDYPEPIVDHATRREEAIAAFERARGS